MNLSLLVNTNNPAESMTHGTAPSSMDKMQPRVMPCNVIPSISIPKNNIYQGSSPTSYSYQRISQAPLSPPEEEPVKCSLPSISSLLEGVDGISRDSETKYQRPNPAPEREWDRGSQSHGSTQTIRDRPVLPPTPPLRPGSGFQEPRHSPAASSVSSHSVSVANLTGPNLSPAREDPDQRRFSSGSVSQYSNRSSFSQSSPHKTSYPPTTTPYASPVEPPANPPEYYRPHPQPGIYAPPMSTPMYPHHQPHQMAAAIPPAAWQHHHYFPPSSTATYPLNQDRYICRTCHKAFSRPSSLRIHSHSHTGEKPFRCPHVGCGKAFSVRSNMKRHERGCHSGRTATSSTLVS
ncbi:hypothetical protein VTO42DRAFT_7799 [Malbranchea cinnamomea]